MRRRPRSAFAVWVESVVYLVTLALWPGAGQCPRHVRPGVHERDLSAAWTVVFAAVILALWATAIAEVIA